MENTVNNDSSAIGGFFDFVGDTVSGGINAWFQNEQVNEQRKLIDAQNKQLALRENVARTTQPGAEPDVNLWANAAGPNSLSGFRLSQDYMLMVAAGLALYLVLK